MDGGVMEVVGCYTQEWSKAAQNIYAVNYVLYFFGTLNDVLYGPLIWSRSNIC
jgi:hypothetical protein